MSLSTFSSLEASLQKLRDLGQATLIFPVPHHNMRFKIRLLYPGEEHMIHAAADAAPDEALPYLDTWHLEALSRIIVAVWIGDKLIFDFTGKSRMSKDYDQELIEVLQEIEGEETKSKWIGKEILLRGVLRSWARDLRHVIFKKYKEMSNEQQVLTQQGVEFKHDTIADEIKILEARLDGLKAKAANDQILTAAVDTFSSVIQAPLEAAQAAAVEDALVIRDSRVQRELVDPEPAVPVAAPANLPEPRVEEYDPDDDPDDDPPTAAALLPPTTVTSGGVTYATKRVDGGLVEKLQAQTDPIAHDQPPEGAVNPKFQSPEGRRVRDRSGNG